MKTANLFSILKARHILRIFGAAVLPFLAFAYPIVPGSAEAQEKAVTVVLAEEPSTLDPCHVMSGIVGRVALGNIVETLTVRDQKTGKLMPSLAASWKQLDELTWRFELRKDVKFHDGTPFNAETAKYAIERNLNPDIHCETRIKFFGKKTLEVTVVDEHTLQLKTGDPDPILPLMMTTHAMYSKSAPFAKRTRTPVGTGPYRLAEWKAGQRIVLERNPDYWGDAPAVEKGTFVWRSESSVRAAMVKQGEADLAPNIAIQDVEPGLGKSYPNSETTRLNLDLLMAPMDDIRIRAAINYAIDRSALQGTVLSKDVIPATQLVLPQINGYNPRLQLWPYNPDLARKLIADAKADGVPVDKEIEFVGRIGHFPGVFEVQQVITQMLNDVGLNVRLQMYETAQKNKMQAKPYAKGRPPQIFVDQHDNNKGDAVFTVYSKYHSEGGSSKTNDPYLDFLIGYATGASGEERTRAWQRVFERVTDDLLADAMLFHMVGYAAIGPRIDYEPSLVTNNEIHLYDISFK
jgi:peptide/nickel transport system substrate-binding protein